MTTCREVYRHICDNLDQKLNSQQCRAIKKHLDTCPECRVYLRSLKTTVQLYRTLPTPPVSRTTHRLLFTAIDRVWQKSGEGHAAHAPVRARRR